MSMPMRHRQRQRVVANGNATSPVATLSSPIATPSSPMATDSSSFPTTFSLPSFEICGCLSSSHRSHQPCTVPLRRNQTSSTGALHSTVQTYYASNMRTRLRHGTSILCTQGISTFGFHAGRPPVFHVYSLRGCVKTS
ncbi:hypothetical protein LSAT2_011078 [Lamellibrachia satsuma]|nr:hypothetical protein LSAT2_011078 [Lamellibrachia satsuma]